tara:strand:+ start:689 stop:1375 length:687 start_codon:yes stop_codon:yes gene_type:complete
MPFLGTQPAETALTTGNLADDIVTLAKLAGGTDGNIISFDSSGNPTYISTGSDGQVLTSAGAGAQPAFETAAAGGKILQVVHVEDGTLHTGTTALPNDDTIPQNTEGDEVMSLAITPANASNKLLIIANITGAGCSAQDEGAVALFQDSTANALSVSLFGSSGAGTTGRHKNVVLIHHMTAGTTSSTTFKIRIGFPSGTARANTTSASGTGKVADLGASNITIMEISA